MQESPEALHEWLCASDVPHSVLRNDPRGDTWLPEHWRRCVDSDDAYRRVFEQFVDEELELGDSVRVARDVWFTNRVVEAAGGVQIYGSGLDPRYRNWIVTAGYAIAIVLCGCFALEFLGQLQ